MDRLRKIAGAVGRSLLRLMSSARYQVMAGMVVVSFLLWDKCFPFSSFPMYGDFPDRTHYVYLADGQGVPLPMHDLFGFRSTKVKRIYSEKVEDIYKALKHAGEDPELHLLTDAQLRPAGDATLRWLIENDRRRAKRTAPLPALRLIHVDVAPGTGGKIERRPRVVGEIPGGAG